MAENFLYNEKEILRRISHDDEKAFSALFDFFSPRVKHIAKLFTRSDALSEDIVQDVFMKIWLKRKELTEITDFKNWIFIVAKNVAINALNKIARNEISYDDLHDMLTLETVKPVTDFDAKDLEKNIRIAMQHLTEQQQKVFELAKLKGMNREEISALLNLSPNTVKMHLVRSTRFIRAYLMAKADHLLSFNLLGFLLHDGCHFVIANFIS